MWPFKNKKTDSYKEFDNENMNTIEPLVDENSNTVYEETSDTTDSDAFTEKPLYKKDFPSGNKSKDLMILIGNAIDEWQKLYHLEKMPKKIVLRQVMAILKQVEEGWQNEL